MRVPAGTAVSSGGGSQVQRRKNRPEWGRFEFEGGLQMFIRAGHLIVDAVEERVPTEMGLSRGFSLRRFRSGSRGRGFGRGGFFGFGCFGLGGHFFPLQVGLAALAFLTFIVLLAHTLF